MRTSCPRFNERFRVQAQQEDAAYRPLDPDVCLDRIFCLKHWRKVGRDNTLKYRWHTLQLLPDAERGSYAGAKVEVLEGLDGTLRVQHGRAHHPVTGGSTASRTPAELKRRCATGSR